MGNHHQMSLCQSIVLSHSTERHSHHRRRCMLDGDRDYVRNMLRTTQPIPHYVFDENGKLIYYGMYTITY